MPSQSDRLRAAADTLGFGLDAAAIARLKTYVALLARWNGVYNLTSVSEPGAMLVQHVFDSLAAVPALRREMKDCVAPRILDIGSGAGLPGVVLAIVEPAAQVTCVDAVGKKAAFVAQISAELRLTNLRSVHARAESLSGENFDLVTSRAFASLVDFTRLTRGALSASGRWMAMKGKTPIQEIADLPPTVKVFHVEQIQVPELTAQRCLVWMLPG